MAGKNWYVYDYAVVDMLEKDFIDHIGAEIPNLNEKYNNVFLLRIDEQNTDFKLHDFGENIYHYEGYMPDFILYLEGADYTYQIYLEPKGQPFVERDRWKEDLLERIEPNNVKVIGENDKVKLYGVKFYVEDSKTKRPDIHHMFTELKEKGIIPSNNND